MGNSVTYGEMHVGYPEVNAYTEIYRSIYGGYP
jgi:hypothetical protein